MTECQAGDAQVNITPSIGPYSASRNVKFSRLAVTYTPKDAIRFWAKVNRNGPIQAHCPDLGPCWLWTAALYSGRAVGYGMFGVQVDIGKQTICYAHRVAWELKHGPVPEGKSVLHHCDVRRCVNYERHLYLGDHTQNMQDASARGRLSVAHPGAQKVTDAQIVEMLNLAAGGMKQFLIAERYGVSRTYVSLLLRGMRRQYTLTDSVMDVAS